MLRTFSKTRIPEKSSKVTCLAIRKAFKNTQVFQRRTLDCTRIKTICHPNNQNKIRIWCLLWLIHMGDVALWYKVDTKLRHVSQSYTNKILFIELFFMLTDEGMWAWSRCWTYCSTLGHALYMPFLEQSEFWYACSHQKISKSTRYTWN